MATVKETQFTRWMLQNRIEMEKVATLEDLLRNPEENAEDILKIQKYKPQHEPWGFEIPYPEYPKYYSWSNTNRKWKRRKRKVINFLKSFFYNVLFL